MPDIIYNGSGEAKMSAAIKYGKSGAYINILDYLEKDEDAWVTTPKELAEWWNNRI